MSTWEDINPDFIGTTAVSKQEMRNQLQHIKNILQNVQTAQGWAVTSSHFLSLAAANVIVPLPDGYSRYRVEFQDLRANTDVIFGMQLMENNQATLVDASSSYYVPTFEHNQTTGSYSDSIGTAGAWVRLTGIQLTGTTGAFGAIDFVYQRNQASYESHYITTAGVRNSRYGRIHAPTPTNVDGLVIFAEGGVAQLQPGVHIKVLAHV
jgi:hypothetical protein